MPACVSLAFALRGDLDRVGEVIDGLESSARASFGSRRPGEDEISVEGELTLAATSLPCVLRAFDEDGWISVALELDEERYDGVANAVGRSVARDALVTLAVGLGGAVGADYLHIDEEAEAETPPGAWDGTDLLGITVVPEDAVGLDDARRREDLQAAVERDGWVVLMRRLDPVPHRPEAWS